MGHPIPTPFTDKIRPGPNNDPETFCQACAERPAQLDLTDEQFNAALSHCELAQHSLQKAKRAARDGDSAMASHAMGHFIHAHHALKGAHYTRDGDYKMANRSSTDVAKALITAQYAFDTEKDMSGRQALHRAMQGLGVMRSGLARAKLAERFEKVLREHRLTKCVVQDDRPLATISKCW